MGASFAFDLSVKLHAVFLKLRHLFTANAVVASQPTRASTGVGTCNRCVTRIGRSVLTDTLIQVTNLTGRAILVTRARCFTFTGRANLITSTLGRATTLHIRICLAIAVLANKARATLRILITGLLTLRFDTQITSLTVRAATTLNRLTQTRTA